MSVFAKYVSLDQPVVFAQETFGYANNEYSIMLREYVLRAYRKLFVHNQAMNIKEIDIPINGVKMRKPCDMADFADLLLMDACCNPCRPLYNAQMWACSYAQQGGCSPIYTVIETCDEFVLSSNAQGKFLSAKLKYYPFKTDAKGLPMIPHEYVETLQYFAEWQHKRKLNTQNYHIMPASQVAQAKRDFNMARREANGNKYMPNNLQMQQLGFH